MKLFQTTDHHIKDDEPFFRAGIALFNWVYDFLKSQTEPFYYLNSGDVFDRSLNHGRVSAEVISFFKKVAELDNCQEVIVLQGNHDVRADTGCALDILPPVNKKISLIKKPILRTLKGQSLGQKVLFIPHMTADPLIDFYSRLDYGKESWWKKMFPDWDEVKGAIEFVSGHLGDETCGKFISDTDISFIPGLRSSGHIHTTVSPNQLESAMITRRDETDKKCVLREFDTEHFEKGYVEHEIPLFLNFAKVKYDPSSNYPDFKDKAETSLILDVENADDEEEVRGSLEKYFENSMSPHVYVGNLLPTEREVTVSDDSTLDAPPVKELFMQFVKEKEVPSHVQELVLSVL